jgi:factor associated with neutral sphingomyelinase activation
MQPLFFWERERAVKGRNRFNLLLLDYGEYFFEDLSAFLIPVPADGSDHSMEVSDALKVQGRLKICSRSIIFEPSDTKKPLTKYPFKNFTSSILPFRASFPQKVVTLVDISGYFTFEVNTVFEMKPDFKVGPYKQIEYLDKPCRVIFSLVHSDLDAFLEKMRKLLRVFSSNSKGKSGFVDEEFSSIISSSSSINAFDTSLLVDFHERLLLTEPVPVKKVSPLVLNPGCLMMTNSRVYFQPTQLNNVGDKVLHFEIRLINRIYKRRYLLIDTGMHITYAYCITIFTNSFGIIV